MLSLSLYFLGPPRLEVDGQAVEFDRRKPLALLAYLAVTGQVQRRDTLAALFWPELDQSRARAALRRTLSILNQALPEHGLEIEREEVSLPADQRPWIDLDCFEQVLEASRQHGHGPGEVCDICLPWLAEAVTLYRDDFLSGFSLRDAPAFDDWQRFEREHLRQKLIEVLNRLVNGYISRGDYPTALDYAQRWASLESLDEGAHRALIQLYSLLGQRPAVARQYETCRRLLAEELGVEPAAETTQLYERLLAGETAPSRPTPPAPARKAEPQPWPAFMATLPALVETPVPFVARDEALAQLQAELEVVLAGQGRVLLISGDAGSGKTALVRHFARQSQERQADLVVAMGQGNAYTGLGDPYLPFREMLAWLSGDIETRWATGMITPENGRRLWALRPVFPEILLKFGPNLVDSFVSGAALESLPGVEPHSFERFKAGQRTQADLFEQFTAVLRVLAQKKPLLLILDDAQWADLASINLLFHLGRQLAGHRLMMLVTYRADEVALGWNGQRHPLEPILHELKRIYGPVQIDLSQGPDFHFVDALLDSEPNRLGPEFRSALSRQTQGHPLFTVELLRAMQERGELVRNEQGEWVESPGLNWQELPARVEAVIEERLARLEPPLRELLTLGSVEGETFTVQVVAQLQDRPERQLLRLLSQELEQRHQLVREQGEVQVNGYFLSRYQFAHGLFQQHLYNSLSTAEKRLLHGEVARSLEQLYADKPGEIIVQLAHHYARAGQPIQAIDYLLRAGDRAGALCAYREAIDYYQQALTLLKQQRGYRRAAQTLMKLGLAYHLVLEFTAARQAYDEGFSLWQRVGRTEPAVLPPAPHPLRVPWRPPLTLDPTLTGDDTSGQLIKQLFSGLMTLDGEFNVLPDVARSWEVFEEGRRYIFYLRDDVFWSDGVPVTADDFVYAWQRSLNPVIHSPHAIYLLDLKGGKAFYEGQAVTPAELGVRAVTPQILEVELESPIGCFLQMLSEPLLYPVPRHVVERYGEQWTDLDKLAGNGPFRLTAWEPDHAIRLSRNPTYHGHFRGNVYQVELLLNVRLVEKEALNRYEADELDMVKLFMSRPEAQHLRQEYLDDYLTAPNFKVQYIGFNVQQAPFHDRRVRHAFAHALNRELLVQVVFEGLHDPATGGLIPPGLSGHSPGIGLPYDPERARQLMAEAGYPQGQNFPAIRGLVWAGIDPVCSYLQQQWQDILGIKLEWQEADWGETLNRLKEGDHQLFWLGWKMDYPDPDNLLRVYSQGSFWNWTRWRNETYTRLVEQASRLTQPVERIRLYQQAERLLIEEAPVVPVLYGRHHVLIKPWLRQSSPTAIHWNLWKDVIIASH